MNLIISPKRAIELATYESNSDLKLHGTCALAAFNSKIALAIKCEDVTNHSFLNIFGTDSKFLYIVEKISNNNVVQYERGIGHLAFIDGNTFLKRIQPLSHGTSANDQIPCYNGPTDFFCKDGEYLIVSNSHPQSYIELFSDPHSILTCSDSFTPQPVVMSENSILARISNSIQSIPFSGEYFISLIIDCLTKYTKQIILKTSKLDLKRLCCDSLQLNINNKPLDRVGTINFDGKNLKYYDGEKWRTLIWKVEDENT